MTRLRLWILIVAVGCFASGLVCGLLLPPTIEEIRAHGLSPDSTELEIREFVRDMEMTPEQERQMRMIIEQYEIDELLVLKSGFNQLSPTLQAAIRTARNRREERIRFILTPEQQRRYEDMIKVQDPR